MLEIFSRPLFFRYLARAASLVVNAAFAVILFSITVNEDAPQKTAAPVIALLILTMMSSFLAWRWERAGALMTAMGAAGLTIAAYLSARSAGLANFSFLAAGLYGFPFMLLSGLFFASHISATKV